MKFDLPFRLPKMIKVKYGPVACSGLKPRAIPSATACGIAVFKSQYIHQMVTMKLPCWELEEGMVLKIT